MRVCYVSAYFDDVEISGIDLVDKNYTLREFAENVAASGHDVDVVHLFHVDDCVRRNGVTYHFVRPASLLTGMATLAGRVRGGRTASHYLPGFRMVRAIDSIHPDVIHFFGLTLDINLWIVARYAKKRAIQLVVQYHGGEPARNRIRRMIQRENLQSGARYLFTTQQHAQPWIDLGMSLNCQKVVSFMETSSPFHRRDRAEAREHTGMAGDPVFLWAGRLHPGKDPVTALCGFERIRECWTGAQLYMYYLTDELLPDLQDFVDRRPGLKKSVYFRGRAPYASMEAVYNSADFFLQASLRETSGCAALEAMSCGVIPVLSDIPSFRKMTEEGKYGILFPVADVDALVDGVLRVPFMDISSFSTVVYSHWMNTLSFPVLASQLDEIYRDVVPANRDRAFGADSRAR